VHGVRPVSDSPVEIPATCDIHRGSGRLVIRGEGGRLVLDGRADHCCVFSLDPAAVTLLFDVLGEWLG
jgi:hypothetical protein